MKIILPFYPPRRAVVAAILFLSPLLLWGQHGVYGGYVGSAAWFNSMRSAAENQAMLRTLGTSATAPGEIPPDYIEFAGQIIFPTGNPFPGHHVPDLRIKCSEPGVDSVDRAPRLSPDGAFYTVFRKGYTYDFSWMYYTGGKEKFASLAIPEDAPRAVKIGLEYRYHQPTRFVPLATGGAPTAGADVSGSELAAGAATTGTTPTAQPLGEPVPGSAVRTPPPNFDRYDLSGVARPPTTLEEQQIIAAIHEARTPATKEFAHAKLARYYHRRGDSVRAAKEHAKAEYWKNFIS